MESNKYKERTDQVKYWREILLLLTAVLTLLILIVSKCSIEPTDSIEINDSLVPDTTLLHIPIDPIEKVEEIERDKTYRNTSDYSKKITDQPLISNQYDTIDLIIDSKLSMYSIEVDGYFDVSPKKRTAEIS